MFITSAGGSDLNEGLQYRCLNSLMLSHTIKGSSFSFALLRLIRNLHLKGFHKNNCLYFKFLPVFQQIICQIISHCFKARNVSSLT